MLIADDKAFENAAMQLWHVAAWCRNEDGLLVAPPTTDVQRYRAAIRGALALLFNAPIKTSSEMPIPGFGVFAKEKTDE